MLNRLLAIGVRTGETGVNPDVVLADLSTNQYFYEKNMGSVQYHASIVTYYGSEEIIISGQHLMWLEHFAWDYTDFEDNNESRSIRHWSQLRTPDDRYHYGFVEGSYADPQLRSDRILHEENAKRQQLTDFRNSLKVLNSTEGLLYYIAVEMPSSSVDEIIGRFTTDYYDGGIVGYKIEFDSEYYENNFSEAGHSVVYTKDNQLYPIFIPAKEMLTHAKGLLAMKKKYGTDMPFDDTLLDIIEIAQAWKLKEMPEIAKDIIPAIEKIIGDEIEYRDDGSFWVKKLTGEVIPFSMEAEGLKRLGLIWQLLMNEGITSDSIVLWDEPEASINPENLPLLVEVMLKLQRHGVQIIAATHSYNFARYFDVLRNDSDDINYFSLFKTAAGSTSCEKAEKFIELNPNPLDDAGEKLYDDIIQKAKEDMVNG